MSRARPIADRLRRARRQCLLAAAGLLCCAPLQARPPGAPTAIDYVLKLRSMPQYQSNPARLSDADTRRQGSQVLVNSVGAAVRIPLLSHQTRLDLSGNIGDARYSDTRQLNHQPRQFTGALPWRATELFAGRLRYDYSDRLYDYLNRTWPERDMETRRRWEAEAGLRITDRLTLPLVSVFGGSSRYDVDASRTLYNRDESGWQAGARYTGLDRSWLAAGYRHNEVDYIDRTEAWRLQIDDRYRDDELFVAGEWDFSPKSVFEARVGWLRRTYAHLSARDTSLLTLDARYAYRHSPKTRLDVYAWRRPYSNDDSPDVVYSILTGGRIAMRWQATPKTSAWLSVARETQDDTRFSGLQTQSTIWRYGGRLAWQADRSWRMVFDAYRQREKGSSAASSYAQNIVRVGLEFRTDNSPSAPEDLFFTSQCDWRHVEYLLC
ncbi:hypothetical protein V8Z80_01550 [Orrella sp. JC864]|uniref:hypothetical protein n=1 Tax=Orrella sp. JC864 TaxID=3120298 RepID=UPI003008BE5B